MKLFIVCGLIIFFICPQLIAQHKTVSKGLFTENKGQIMDQNKQTRSDILCYSSKKNHQFFIKKNGVSHQLVEHKKTVQPDLNHASAEFEFPENQVIETYRVDINFLNSNENVSIQKTKKTKSYSNYYTNPHFPDGITHVTSFEEIMLKNVYEGIDIAYYFKNGELEYDFIVAKEADFKQIKLEIKGSTPTIDSEGNLVLKTTLGTITQSPPNVFQDKQKLVSRWSINENIASFEIENYNTNETLIIDPIVRVWSTYYGGENSEGGIGANAGIIKNDSEGNVLLASQTSSTTFIATTGAFATTLLGSSTPFLAKLDATSNQIWSTYFAQENTSVEDMAVSNLNEIICVGQTSSTDNISSTLQTLNGNSDGYIFKFGANGTRLWSSYFGGENNDRIDRCNVDSANNIFLTGYTNSTNNIAFQSNYLTAFSNTTDHYLVKLDLNGNQLWGTYLQGINVSGCQNDEQGNLIISGKANSSQINITTLNAFQDTINGSNDSALMKFDGNGNLIWCTYYGGLYDDLIYGSCIDYKGNVFLAGETRSLDLNLGLSSATNYGGFDALISKFNPAGNLVWTSLLGSSKHDEGRGCATDMKGNVFLTGFTTSLDSIASDDGFKLTNNNLNDGFIAKFDSLGNRIWSTFYGSSSSDYMSSISCDNNGNFYGLGLTDSPTDIATSGAFKDTISGTHDLFIVKFNDKDWSLNTSEISNQVSNVSIFPNPSQQTIRIENIEAFETLEIYDFIGRKIDYLTINNQNAINYSFKQKSGIYSIRLLNKDKEETHKVILH